ncbi:MAG TPA: transglutaminase-like domain-containing protein [Anaerovoracaceae bacterium]|nr:transglutaminase-like domain-containing protein [Anaerovoracaceae bacterium]
MQLKSDYYDTDFEFTYKGNTILIRNDGPEGESLYVNGVLQDQNFGAHNGHLIGHILDEEKRREVIEVFLGGLETSHCMVYANGSLIHADAPPSDPVMMHEEEVKIKKRAPNWLTTLLLIILLAAVAALLLPYLGARSNVEPPDAASTETGGPALSDSVSASGVPDSGTESDQGRGTAISDNGPEVPESRIEVNYTWNYGRDHWTYSLSIPESTYRYYRTIDRKGIKSYSYYVTDSTDDESMSGLAEKFKEAAEKGNYSDYDMVKNIIFFVQNLNYVDDKVGTGYDEYPKFPLETLADEGGDCEDSAILLASLLRELGYSTVLIQFENHMAVGVKGGESISGSYFEVDGSRYYYVETTSPGWDIGEVPEPMIDQPARILTLN